MKKIAILGASFPQRRLVEEAKRMSVETHVFAWDKGNIVKDIADYCYPISTLDKEAILKKCIEIKIDGILTVGSDIAVDTVNYVAGKLSLVGNSMDTSMVCRDKHLMRSSFKTNGIPSIKFQLIKTEKDLEKTDLKYPFMVKATDRSGSRGVTRVNNLEEAKVAFKEALEVSLNKKVIIEEYFEGVQYSMEMISQNNEHYFAGITEEFYTGPPYFVEKAHVVPGRIDEKLLLKAINLTKDTLAALKFVNGASHTELRINEDNEFCIIEVAGRMGGDFRAEMVENAYGYNYLEDTIKIALGIGIKKVKNVPIQFSFVKWILNKEDKELLNDLSSYNILDKNIYGEINESEIQSSEFRMGYVLGTSKSFPNIVLNKK